MRTRLTVLALSFAALAGAGTAGAATPPSVSTGPVTALGPTTATVSGSVNPEGTATSWHVEYGTTTTYGQSTTPVSAGSGTTTQAVSASLSSLHAGTTYHYRFVAVSTTAGTSRGADGILTTSSMPAVVTGTASSVTPTSATLNGTVDPSGRPTTWYFEYGTSTGYGQQTTHKDAGSGTGATAVSAPITGLTTGRTYHFRLDATSDAGTVHGADQTFVSSAAPTATTKPATSVKDTSATLNGSVDPNGLATTISFEYGTSTSYGSKTPASNAGSGTSTKNVSAPVTGLAAGMTYHFRIVATNTSGTTDGADQTFTTSGKPVVHTGTPTSVTGTSAALTGTVDPAGHSTSWYFEYGATTGYGGKTSTQSAGSTAGARAVSAPVGGLTPGATYHFRLVASNSAGTSFGADATFTTVGPAVTIAASGSTAIYGHRVTLHGTVSSKQANASVAVYAARIGNGSFVAVATVLTGSGGGWTLSVRPPLSTSYKALFGGGSAVTTVFVRPAVSLATLSGHRFTIHVAGARSFAGRIVQLQRHRLDGRWAVVGRWHLGARSTVIVRPKLPHGRLVLRAVIGPLQVGTGYVAGYSAWLTYRVR